MNSYKTSTKYIFCPFRQGMGLNNRRQVFEFCIMLAYTLNRTLILNKKYPKTIHNNISVNITDVWNINMLKQFINIKIVDNITINKDEINYISSPFRKIFTFSEYRENIFDKKYILLSDMFTWIYLSSCLDLTDSFTSKVYKLKNKYLSFSEKIINKANMIKTKINSDYISIHFRLGDMRFKPIYTSYHKTNYNEITENDINHIIDKIDLDIPVLICTNKRKNDIVQSICKKYKTIFCSDIINDELNEIELCCIEMLLSSESKIHIPSINSSWDEYVLLNRYDNSDLLKLWINTLQKRIGTNNKIDVKLLLDIL